MSSTDYPEDVFVGDTLQITATATTPGPNPQPITDATVVAEFFNPGKNPRQNPGDRTVDHTLNLVLQGNQFIGTVTTDPAQGWIGDSSVQWCRVRLTGQYTVTTYCSFSLKP